MTAEFFTPARLPYPPCSQRENKEKEEEKEEEEERR